MKRKIEAKLLAWKENKHNRLPLLVDGARQVGKSYSIEAFGAANFQQTIKLDFEKDAALCSLFDVDLAPALITEKLESYFNIKIEPENTLIFFDEVQKCERAMTSLKYFAEDALPYYVIAAGSLLGVSIHRHQSSFPVGKVQIVGLHPLDFEEFLWAKKQEYLSGLIRSSYATLTPLSDTLHKRAFEFYYQYLVTGGMPASVVAHINSEGGLSEEDIRIFILNAYAADMVKYAESPNNIRITAAYQSIPAQLAKPNKKFQYKLVQSGGRASILSEAISWLDNAGVVLRCNLTTQGDLPPSAFIVDDSFKLYLNDVGLLSQRLGITYESLKTMGMYKGSLAENYIAQTLNANGYELMYWSSGNMAEVDFLLVRDGKVIPVEVKADANVRSKSLHIFANKYKPEYLMRVSSKHFGNENGIHSIPLYAAFCL